MDVSVTSSPVYDDGRIIGVSTTTLDITERRRAEEALRESQAELETVSNTVPALLFRLDLARGYVFIERHLSCVVRCAAGGRAGNERPRVRG